MTDEELAGSNARSGSWMENPSARWTTHVRSSVGGALPDVSMRPPVLAPIFLAAWVGSEENLPTRQHVYADPRAHDATDLMGRLLRGHFADEANPARKGQCLPRRRVCFPLLLCAGRRTQSQAGPRPGSRSEFSQLACDAYAAIERGGPISKHKLLETLGGGVSQAALDKALAELWSKLRVTRVDYNATEGAFWDVLYRWAPDAVKEGVGLSVVEALSALVSKYLDCVVAAELHEIEEFFGRFVARSKVKDAVNGLLSARELSYVTVGRRPLLQMTPAKLPRVASEYVPKAAGAVPDLKKTNFTRSQRPKFGGPPKFGRARKVLERPRRWMGSGRSAMPASGLSHQALAEAVAAVIGSTASPSRKHLFPKNLLTQIPPCATR